MSTRAQGNIDSIVNELSLKSDDLNIDFRYYLLVLRKYKWLIVAVTLLITGAAAYYAQTLTPLYRATSTLLIESQKANTVSIEELYGVDGGNSEYYQTQFELLRSRALAEKVVRKLKLTEHPLYIPSEKEPSTLSLNALLGSDFLASLRGGEKAEQTAPVEEEIQLLEEVTSDVNDPPNFRGVVGSFRSNLSIEPVRGTKLVKISFVSPDPELAALVANTVGETYIESYLDAKMELTERAASWLSERLGGLQVKLDESEQKLLRFREDNGLVDLSGDVGQINERQLENTSLELMVARRELAEVDSLYSEMTRLQLESPTALETIPTVQKDELVRSFKLEFLEQQRELDELSNRYGSKHPKIIDAQSRVDAARDNLQQQINRVVASVQKQYEIANQRVQSLSRSVARGKSEILDIAEKKVQLAALQREVDANRKLYQTFFNRIKEADEADGLDAANARISDRALPPGGSFKPRKSMIVGLAFIMGLVGSILFAFVREFMDDSVKGTEEIEARLNLPLLGIIPMYKAGLLRRKSNTPLSPFEIKDKRGTFTESVRTIRTSLCMDSWDNPHKKVVITSSVPGEGKSTLAVNLAHSLSQLEKVILIEADMRRPVLRKTFALSSSQPGLANYLQARNKSEAVHISDCVVRNINDSNLDVLACGDKPENPLDLLSSPRFHRLLDKLSAYYDRIILDCAPTQAVSDALVLGKQADTVIYAVKSHSTPLHLISRGVKRLRQVGSNVIGIVSTQVDVDKIKAYGGDYYYQGYYDQYGYNSGSQKAASSASARAFTDTESDRRASSNSSQSRAEPA